jgi:ABC-type glycerol-3-phosphate transport system permease component
MRRRAVTWIGGLALYLVVSGVAVLMLLPFYWMVMTAFSPAPDIIAFPPKWIPSYVTFEHFQVAFEKAAWFRYYGNSAFVAVVSVGCSLLFGLFAGYAFAVYRFPFQTFFFLLILGTLMVPVQVTAVALYVLLSQVGWVDTFLGILAPNFAKRSNRSRWTSSRQRGWTARARSASSSPSLGRSSRPRWPRWPCSCS